MAKKQTRRSISVSRVTYERLKAFCETNNISMSQLVETRVNDFLGNNDFAPAVSTTAPSAPHVSSGLLGSSGSIGTGAVPSRPGTPVAPRAAMPGASTRPADARGVHPAAVGPTSAPAAAASSTGTPASHPPMTSAAARFAVEPPPPIIKPRQETVAPKPAEKRPEQIFTF